MSFHNGVQTQSVAPGLSRPQSQQFEQSPPQQYGVAQAIPVSTMGDTSLKVFHKINRALSGARPLAKIVIGTQQSRF